MFYLTRHERSVLLFLAAVLFFGSLAQTVFDSSPSILREMDGEERFVFKTNVNTASHEELVRVPYIGEATARAIIAYRREKGKIDSLDEIRSIASVYPSNYEKMIKYLAL